MQDSQFDTYEHQYWEIQLAAAEMLRTSSYPLRINNIWIVCYTRLYHLREIFETMDRAECVCQRKNNELLKYKLYIYILMSTQRCSFCYWLFTMNNSTYRVALHQQCNGRVAKWQRWRNPINHIKNVNSSLGLFSECVWNW